MILGGGHASESDLARFRTEAEAIARLQHPNIVQVFEVGEHDWVALLRRSSSAAAAVWTRSSTARRCRRAKPRRWSRRWRGQSTQRTRSRSSTAI